MERVANLSRGYHVVSLSKCGITSVPEILSGLLTGVDRGLDEYIRRRAPLEFALHTPLSLPPDECGVDTRADSWLTSGYEYSFLVI